MDHWPISPDHIDNPDTCDKINYMNLSRRGFFGALTAAPAIALALPTSLKRVLSPIPEVDRSIAGDMDWNKPGFHVIAGPCGSGRTSIGYHIVVDKLQIGKRVMYLTDEMFPKSYLQQFLKSGQLQMGSLLDAFGRYPKFTFDIDTLVVDAINWRQYQGQIYGRSQKPYKVILLTQTQRTLHAESPSIDRISPVSAVYSASTVSMITNDSGVITLKQVKNRYHAPDATLRLKFFRTDRGDAPLVSLQRLKSTSTSI